MGSVKPVNLCSCCWEQWGHLCSGLSLPSRRGRGHGQCPHTLPQIPFLQELQRESIYTYRKEMVFLKFTHDTCLSKYICSGLRVECSGLCTFLSLLQPHFLLFSSYLWESIPCPGEAPGPLVVQHALGLTQEQWTVEGQPQSCGDWLWFGGCRPLAVVYRTCKYITCLGLSLADCPNMVPKVKSF